MFIPGMDFMFVAIGISIVVRAIRGGSRRSSRMVGDATYAALQRPADDPRVPQLQAEVDELRAQVDRLQAAESFYTQLNAPAPGAASAAPPVAERPAGVSPPAGTGPRTG